MSNRRPDVRSPSSFDPRANTTEHRATAPQPTSPARKRDAFLCDRCNAEMFRMHAVWRCPECGFKTDCCGW